ncbi:Reverse transcriptase domain [Trinorchestia longiramus]|nr:Reverse transcriptase domain [Trinorchestia longiramus]
MPNYPVGGPHATALEKAKIFSEHFRRHSPTTATTGSDESIRVNNANYFETEESREVPCLTIEELNSSLSALKNKAPGQDGGWKNFVKWLKNYLTGRTASVRLGAVQSEGVPITWGLPQGAVLSPLLFNIMLSDLPVADGVQLIIYADDITILSKGDSLAEVRACLQRYLDSLAAWFKKWKLIVNPAKCSEQIFTKKHSIPDVILRLNNSVVRNVTCQRVLGIVFDAPRLMFAAHIGNLVGGPSEKVTSAASPVSGTLGCISHASSTGVYSIYQKQARVRMVCLGNATVRQPQKTCCITKYGVTQHIGSEKNQPSFVPGGGVNDTPTGAAAPIADSSLVYPSHE